MAGSVDTARSGDPVLLIYAALRGAIVSVLGEEHRAADPLVRASPPEA